jgi:hypothetical protein
MKVFRDKTRKRDLNLHTLADNYNSFLVYTLTILPDPLLRLSYIKSLESSHHLLLIFFFLASYLSIPLNRHPTHPFHPLVLLSGLELREGASLLDGWLSDEDGRR